MKTIHKYQMKDLVSPVMMAEGAEILSIQIQHSVIYIWAMINIEAVLVERNIAIFATGQDLPYGIKGYKYITTLQIGLFVWHFFERLDHE